MDEYKVKAAFLFNFVKFVEWPVGTFRRSNEQIVICILGEDPFGRSLEDTVASRTIEGRSLVVRHIPNIKRAAGCHVLFVSFAENKRSEPMLGELKMPGILTIGESGVTGEGGVIINFKLDGGKVRFEINVQTAERGNLRISPLLLNLAHIVDSNPPPCQDN